MVLHFWWAYWFFEVDNNLFLTPSALVFHLQDTAIRHSASLGYTLDYMAEHHRGWAVVNWHIIIDHICQNVVKT